MRKNVFLKSTVRQLVRTILLAILIGIASFFFVSRVVEYQIVTTETERIGGHYRSIGFFAPIVPTDETDLTEVVDIISKSPYFAFGDHTRYVFASLSDMHNADIMNMGGYWMDIYGNLQNIQEVHDILHVNAYFYGRLLNKRGPSFTEIPFYTLQVYVDAVVEGYPEHVAVGYEVDIRWVVKDGVRELLEQMEIGNRYFFSTNRHTGANLRAINPASNVDNWHYLKMLNQEESIGAFLVEDAEEINFADHRQLAHIPADLELLRVNQRAMRAITSVDVGAMPRAQELADEWFLLEGRWINHEDYMTENPVVVVNWLFATIRELSIGDTITLEFRDVDVYIEDLLVHRYDGWFEILVTDETWREQETYQEIFEIVGIFGHSRRETTHSIMTKDFFVPESTVPPIFGAIDFISHLDYSFVLNSTKYQDAFTQQYEDVIAALGFHLHFIEHGGERFWQSAHPILRSLSFNMLLFIGVFLGVVGLIILLYFIHRKRDLAILRVLGCPMKRVVSYLYMPIFLVWLPFILLGSGIGWVSAHNAAETTISALVNVYEGEVDDELLVESIYEQEVYVNEYEENEGEEAHEENERADELRTPPSLSFRWLIGLSMLAIVVPLAGMLVGFIPLARKPVLEILQGDAGKRRAKRRRKSIDDVPTELRKLQERKIDSITHVLTALETKGSNIRKAIRLHTKRRIMRTPLKTIFVVGIAFLFIFAIGWLQNAITQGNEEINRLYDTTIVRGEFRPLVPGEFDFQFPMKQVIRPRTVDIFYHVN